MKIAIVGNGILTRDAAPFNDPDWITWGLSGREHEYQKKYNDIRDFDVLWECHNYKWDKEYLLFMKSNNVQIPRANYEFLAKNEGFKSSIAYMLAEAILVKPEAIAIYGLDACIIEQEEYQDQIPNIKYFMGLAVGKGIKVSAPEICNLFEKSAYGR